MFVSSAQRSLPQSLGIAVAKAVAGTAALLVAHVGLAMHSDYADIAEGRRTPPPAVQPVDQDRLLTLAPLE